jgi:uncharacterized protein YndB with AHSA1/START domain
MERTIVHRFQFAHPPQMVWEYLTDAELLAQWLMPNDFKPEVGHAFQFHTKPRIKLGFDGIVHCRVLEVVPYQRLSYTWKGGMSKDNPSLDSVVVWTLTEVNGHTELLLEHKGFKGFKNLLSYFIMNKGWEKIGKRIGKKMAYERA